MNSIRRRIRRIRYTAGSRTLAGVMLGIVLFAAILGVRLPEAESDVVHVVASAPMPTPIPLVTGVPTPWPLGNMAGVPYAGLFLQTGAEFDVPPRLLAGIAKFESAFNPRAVSTDAYKSRGLGQFIYETWGFAVRSKGWTWADAFDPVKNIWAMGMYADWLRGYLARPGMTERQIVERMVTGWNWGPGNVLTYGVNRAPAMTRRYVANVLAFAGY